jgi:hypothetical protein
MVLSSEVPKAETTGQPCSVVILKATNLPFSVAAVAETTDLPFSEVIAEATTDLPFSAVAVVKAGAGRLYPEAAVEKAVLQFSAAAAGAAHLCHGEVAGKAVLLSSAAAAEAAGVVRCNAVHPDQAGAQPGLQVEAAGAVAVHPAGRNLPLHSMIFLIFGSNHQNCFA